MDTPTPEPTATYWAFSLSPVQSFIAEARRSRDLLAGSRILAWLAGCLLARLGREGATFLLPKLAHTGQEKDVLDPFLEKPREVLAKPLLPIPNRASGTLPCPLEEAREKLHGLHAALAEDWATLLQIVEKDAARSATEVWELMGRFITQAACPLELTWVVCEAPADSKAGLARVDALHAAAKRSRPIPPHQGAEVRKCGQCGRREALGGEDPASFQAFQARLSKLDEVQRELRFSPAEHLCPICALRRFAGYLGSDPFPSTSAIAASEWRWRLVQAGLEPALESLENVARKAPGFEPAWADLAPLYYETTARREGLDFVLAAQKKLAAAIEQSAPELAPRPPDYLAVVMFDGDDMGQRLREHLDVLPESLLRFQCRLQKTLELEAAETAPLGVPFYLGGDEGLLLAPVGRVLDLAAEICRLWHEEIDVPAQDPSPRPSLSMGITLFGRERPLGPAIESARRALEQSAKGMKEKRALAVSVMTASGNAWSTVAHWGESWERIRAAVAMIRDGDLAAGWPHDVESFLRTLPEAAFKSGEVGRKAIRAEVQRITHRRLFLEAEKRPAAWKRLGGDSWWSAQPTSPEIESLPEQLHLVAFLARQAGAEHVDEPPRES